MDDRRPTAAKPSLRERKKIDKRGRILAAATELFAEKGYSAVTTAEIASAADVGVGTLFRYAGSKAELLVSVMNQRFSDGIEAGLSEAAEGRTIQESVLAILHPLAEASMAHPENMIAYEREALFGSEERRKQATDSVSQVEQAILEVLRLHNATPRNLATKLEDIAHTIYAVLYLDIVKVGAGRAQVDDLPNQIRTSVNYLVEALIENRQA
ncbi:TetR/AcrR family transcriptional regulator [Propionimicrobium sp. PCR01-08-3]|uniref:TetR/AcrR family transcriptional regulator n=1 Tax=Propionimicrobium sp. PCR01-08-3 TaxID=3052086 RepID=UPI00255CE8CF|nr:TetR/AcrR family transcriptional regulator [Propionimicrobium sp. PCR01-08-3]WIY81719.1 helix-turn-helix domain-containing protein [Propionimicrobium sp. PCR01-08-3]